MRLLPLREHSTLLWWLGSLSLVTFVASLIFIPLLVAWMPADYFTRKRPYYRGRHPLVHWAILIAKNLFGALFLLTGLAMLFLPGQGLITIVIALTLLNFPGKRRLECRLIRRPGINRAINWIRARKGRPPLLIPETDCGEEQPAEHGG
ncbi:MAG: hypothetical protein JW781_05055 [Deltaproteobacteria bacterium]|nr:hypothetical protein [Candidatus Anaeroferrophillacea bacterium]